MSGAAKLRAVNVASSEDRPVLGPGGNKVHRPVNERKSVSKPLRKSEKSIEEAGKVVDGNACSSSPILHCSGVPSILRRQESLSRSSFSLNASCSSDASTDSFHSRASTGRIYRTSSMSGQRKHVISKKKIVVSDGDSECSLGSLESKRRCAWVTPNTDISYVTFHDEEWGVPAHDDRKLFELLALCGALAELTWPAILHKRKIFREVFADFDPVAVSQLNEKKMMTPGSTATSLLSELKLRAIIENARQVSKVIDEFGSFDKYIWSFVNHKPIVSRFRYPRQVPVKTPKADVISKDLVRRGFRSVGPTVIYSFMQVAGITNDHLLSCFRFNDCLAVAEGNEKDGAEVIESQICKSISELSLSLE